MSVNPILMSQPWSFHKHLVVMQRYEKDIPLSSFSFETVMFWVQAHDIPICYMNMEVSERNYESIGKVVRSIGAETERGGGNFMRVRIKLDISMPLCRGRIVS